jgi:protein-tyrosine-phosphatase
VESNLRAIRARTHAALGDAVRLAIVDDLTGSDRSPVELRRRLDIESNLLAHHLDVLEEAGLIERSRSSGDGRRRYVHLRASALDRLGPTQTVDIGPALFVCTANSARSQLAAALWEHLTGHRALSAGTHPADRVNPLAVDAAERAGLDLSASVPRTLAEVRAIPRLVITVCDRAHEELPPSDEWLHWSVPDPVPIGTDAVFDATVAELQGRIEGLAGLAEAS